jgi:hypothetical protein
MTAAERKPDLAALATRHPVIPDPQWRCVTCGFVVCERKPGRWSHDVGEIREARAQDRSWPK